MNAVTSRRHLVKKMTTIHKATIIYNNGKKEVIRSFRVDIYETGNNLVAVHILGNNPEWGQYTKKFRYFSVDKIREISLEYIDDKEDN